MNRQSILNLSPLDLDAVIAGLRRDSIKYIDDILPGNRYFSPPYHSSPQLSRQLLDELREDANFYWEIVNGPGYARFTIKPHITADPIVGPVECDSREIAIARVYLLWRMREQNEGAK